MAIDSAGQSQPVRTVLAINQSQIEVLTDSGNEIQEIARAVSEVTETSRFVKDLTYGFFKAWIAREKSYDRCFHTPSVREDRDACSAVIAI